MYQETLETCLCFLFRYILVFWKHSPPLPLCPLTTFGDGQCALSFLLLKCTCISTFSYQASVNVKRNTAASNHCWGAVSCWIYLDQNIKQGVSVVISPNVFLKKILKVRGTSFNPWFAYISKLFIWISHHIYWLFTFTTCPSLLTKGTNYLLRV